MRILGLSGLYHDSAAALLQEGRITQAAQEERFSRLKHDASFPLQSGLFCLEAAGLKPPDLDHIVFYEKPFLKFDRILMRHLKNWPHTLPSFEEMQKTWFTSKLRIRSQIRKQLRYQGPIHFCRHHESHAASAFFSSPFEKATIITVDGVGEWTCSAIHKGEGNRIETLFESAYPHSWGLFYSAFTDYLGFDVNDGEYKVMGLAPYGSPRFTDLIESQFIRRRENGLIELNPRFFTFEFSDFMLDFERSRQTLGFPRRDRREKLDQEHFDLAASVQKILEDGITDMVRFGIQQTGSRKVCLAGGVALNCKANSKILNLPEVEDLYVFPAAGDAGAAVGAAQFACFQLFNHPRVFQSFATPYLGPEFSNSQIQEFLNRNAIPYARLEPAELTRQVARLLADQKIVGWFQGAMEFGPRALGNRSILGDPRRRENWDRINQKVKFREDFRPLAPAVCLEDAGRFFDLKVPSPYMILTGQSRTSELPAVTHRDGSARLQTVSNADNPLFHQLLKEFEKISGVPVLINTSFNTAGMPIVQSPQNAYRAFAESDLDAMALGSFLIERKNIPYLLKAPHA